MKSPLLLIICLALQLNAVAQDTVKIKKPDSLPAPAEEVYNQSMVEEQPAFPGGNEGLYAFIGKNITYPQTAKELGLGGAVYVSFIIDTDGSVKDVQIVKGISAPSKIDGKELTDLQKGQYTQAAVDMNNEARHVISILPKWSPGKMSGRKVKVKFILPIKYKLQ